MDNAPLITRNSVRHSGRQSSKFFPKPTFKIIRMVVVGLVAVLPLGQVVKSEEFTAIPVPINVIYAGQVISKNLLRDRRVPLSYLKRVSVLVQRNAAIGKIARVTLMPSRPIATNQIAEADVVKVNRPTILEYSIGQLRITAEVMPLNSAKSGEIVRARNIQSGVIVLGIAQSNGQISAGIAR